MLFPVIDPEEWAETYSITISTEPCRNCRKLVTPTVPFADGHVRGLITPDHGCPPRYDQYIMVSVRSELVATIKKLSHAFSDPDMPA